ncbi:MAG: YHS domain-containing (seleno)protein [Flavobacteriaceae bacterium]|nr:YHS domain-containing (seleno)protein [Flavobacteriaceae bacterium]
MPQKSIPLIFCILFIYSFGPKQLKDIDIAHFNTASLKLVGDGYDLVSYFFENKPIKGKSSISSQYQGLLFYFSSQENKDLFINDPTRYLPKYGGWCAYAIGDYAKKVDVDPLSYTIENGELYLFYKSYFNDTREKWIKNHDVLKQSAEENWQKIID